MNKQISDMLSPPLSFRGQAFRPVGVNLGGWLNLEGYMLGLEGTDWQIRTALRRQFGDAAADAFFDAYERTFVSEADVREIARLGFNTVRLPLNWRRFECEAAPSVFNEAGFAPVDRLLDWCAQHGLAVLLDLHAAPGGQNTTHPADNTTGYSLLWQNRHAQDRVVAWWEATARRYAGHPALLGYNLLNEPQVDQHGELDPVAQAEAMNQLYGRCLEAIRAIDPDGWIAISPPVRSSGGEALLDRALFEDERTAFAYHHYPLASFERGINYEPEREHSAEVARWHRFLAEQTASEVAFAAAIERPVILGEFGWPRQAEPERARACLEAQLRLHQERGWGWLLWAYKDLNRLGLYQCKPDQPWHRFATDPEWSAKRDRCLEGFAETFDRVYVAELGKTDATAKVYDAAWGDGQRGLKRILLEHQMRRLAEFSDDSVAEMAEAFRLENCAQRTELAELLARFIQA